MADADPLTGLATTGTLSTANLFGAPGQGDTSTGLFGSTPIGQETPASEVSNTPAGIFAPQKPNYSTAGTGAGSMQTLLKSLYSDQDPVDPTKVAAAATAATPTDITTTTPANPPATTDAGSDAANAYLQHGNQFVADTEHDRLVGAGTTFGLDYDSGGYDAEDNGQGAFGYNTRDKSLEGASLPISVIKNSIGDYQKDSSIFQAIKRGDYKVAVTNQDGTTRVVPIVDAGPAEWTGNAIDLTYKTSHDLNTGGKAQLGYQIIGPDGDTVKIKGFHPGSVSKGNWHDHIGVQQIPNYTGGDSAKPEQIPNYTGGSKAEKIPDYTGDEEAPTPHKADETTKEKPAQSLSANTGATGKLGADEAMAKANQQLSPQEQKDADSWLSWDWNKGQPSSRINAAYDKRAALIRQLMGT